MNFKEMSYDQFWLKHFSYSVKTHFTAEEIQWAIKQTEYKYFGDYDLSDQQKMAVDILVWASSESLKGDE